MHKLYTFILCLCLFCFVQPLLGEAVQRVLVVEYIPDLQANGRLATKRPLPNVEVQIQGASSTITNKNGECVLRFNTMSVGDRIVVRRVSRPGYELFYPQMLADMVIRRDSEPLVITMVSQENLVNLSRQTEKMVNNQIEKQKKQEVNRLNPAAVDYARQREEIEHKYTAKLNDVEQYIDRLVRIDFTNLSKNEREIAEAFEAGDLDQVLVQFEKSNLIEKYKSVSNALNQLKKAHTTVDKARINHEKDLKEIIQYLQYQITLLKMEGSEASTKKAMNLLERMLDIDPFGHFQMKEYMQFAIQQKEFRYIDSLIRRHLQDPDLNRYYNCRYLSDLGAILFEQMRYDEAIPVLNEVFRARQGLYDGGIAESPLSIFHMFSNNQMLGRMYAQRGENELAKTHFKRAYDSYLSLRELDSSNKLYVDVSYKRMYIIITSLFEINEWTMADSIFNATYKRVQINFSQGTVRERFIVAAYKMLNVQLLRHKGMAEEALNQEMELLSELSQLYAVNRPLCEDLYQLVLLNVTMQQYEYGNYEQMIYFADQWFTVLNSIRNHRQGPDQRDGNVSFMLNSRFTEVLSCYANSLKQLGNFNRSEMVYCQVIDLMEEDASLAQLFPQRLALCYANVAKIRLDKGEIDSALNMANRALAIEQQNKLAKEVLDQINGETSSKK